MPESIGKLHANGLAMFSSGIEAQNFQNKIKLIKSKYFNINHLPAIKYSCCYAFVFAGGEKIVI